MTQSVIELNDVSMEFMLQHHHVTTIKEQMLQYFAREAKQPKEPFWALKDINLKIEHGEALGILGPNGSGKSTLLKVIARILTPTTGQVAVRDKIVPLIELGLGFHPELTGEENFYLNGALFGLSRNELRRIYPQAIDFSGIGKFIDIPVKNYSSGMRARLGFSIVIHLDPEILLIDEVLAVGDEEFQAKCISWLSNFKNHGKTVILVSHHKETVNMLCDRAVCLQDGMIADEYRNQ